MRRNVALGGTPPLAPFNSISAAASAGRICGRGFESRARKWHAFKKAAFKTATRGAKLESSGRSARPPPRTGSARPGNTAAGGPEASALDRWVKFAQTYRSLIAWLGGDDRSRRLNIFCRAPARPTGPRCFPGMPSSIGLPKWPPSAECCQVQHSNRAFGQGP